MAPIRRLLRAVGGVRDPSAPHMWEAEESSAAESLCLWLGGFWHRFENKQSLVSAYPTAPADKEVVSKVVRLVARSCSKGFSGTKA